MYGFFRLSGKWRIWLIVAAVSGVVAYGFWDASAMRDTFAVSEHGRFNAWLRAFDVCAVREAWVLGFGLGSWIFLFPVPSASLFRAHCEPIQIWWELGAAGVLALLLYGRFLLLRFVGAGRTGAALYASAGMAAVLLCAAGNFPFHLAGVAAVCTGWMAMFDIETRGI